LIDFCGFLHLVDFRYIKQKWDLSKPKLERRLNSNMVFNKGFGQPHRGNFYFCFSYLEFNAVFNLWLEGPGSQDILDRVVLKFNHRRHLGIPLDTGNVADLGCLSRIRIVPSRIQGQKDSGSRIQCRIKEF
jgi:hypothetical protein